MNGLFILSLITISHVSDVADLYRIESKEKGRGGIPPKCGFFFFLLKKKKRGRETTGNIRTHVILGCQIKELIADDSQTIRHEPHVLSMIKA